MDKQGFNVKEQFFLDSHDFYLYDDPLLQSIRAWEITADQWGEQVRFLHQTASYDIFEAEEAKLADLQSLYARHFADAAAAVVAESPIQEIAIPTIGQLIHDEDARRRQKLANWYTKFDIDEPADHYVHDLAMAFGDPQGATLPHGSRYVVFDQDTAAEYFASRLSDQASLILDTRRHIHERYRDIRSQKRLGKTALWRLIKGLGKRQAE